VAFAGAALVRAQAEELRSVRNRRYAARLASEHIPAIDGVADTLAALSPRVRMGVVTSSNADHFEIIHQRLDLRRHFEFVLTHESYSTANRRPSLICLDWNAWACGPMKRW
jgi:beta-phosphoglucomutase-like phosphatase (HAD superfamily)